MEDRNLLPYQPPKPVATAELWRRHFRTFKRHWWVPLLFASAILCYRAYKLQQLPDEYISTAKLVLQGRIQLGTSSSYREEMIDLFGTQKELLESRQLEIRAKNQLNLLHPDLESGPISLNVSQDSQSSVINLTARGQQGLYAQAFLNCVLDQYMALRGEMRSNVSDETLIAINEQLDRLTKQVEQKEAAVAEYHRENDVVVLQEGSNTAADYLAQLVDRKADLETRLNFLRKLDIEQDINRRSQLTDPAKPETGAELGHLASSERDFLQTKREIAMLQVELDRLSTIMKPRHPKIRELQSRIAKSNALLAVFLQQSEALNLQRARALEVELDTLNHEITTWKAKTLNTSRRLAESNRLTDDLERTRNLHEKLLLSMHEVDQARNLDQDTFSIMERASAPAQVLRNSIRPLLGGSLMGLFAGFGLLVLLNRLDDRLHTPGEYFERFEHNFLGSIPEIKAAEGTPLLPPENLREYFAEAYRKLRSSILYKKWEQGVPKSMLVTSAIPFDGKSTVASNLAAVLAMSGAEVLLIDADLRRGALHGRFEEQEVPGLGDVLMGACPVNEAIVETDHANLDLLPKGNTNVAAIESFAHESTRQLFLQLEAVYDYIVVDSAPVLVADDTLSLAPLVDTTLFVIRLNRTPGRLAERGLANLKQRQVPVGGVILNSDDTYVEEYYAYHYSECYAEQID